jgi:hypothetical protein
MHMRYAISLILGAVAVLGLSTAVPASAATSSVNALSCQVLPGSGSRPGNCFTGTASRSYIVEYTIQNVAVTGWSTPAGYPVVAGCTPGVQFCDLSARATIADQSITTQVAYNLINTGGLAASPFALFTSSATAFIPGVCGTSFC